MEPYIYELLVIDKDGQAGITKADSLFRGLLFSETLWRDAKEVVSGDSKKIVDDKLSIELKFQVVDTSKALNDLIEVAFIIKIKGEDFDSLAKFRHPFLIHLKRLKFTNIRILKDDISTEISNKIYPFINKVENLLRRYVVKFFIQKIGLDWFGVTVSKQLTDKLNLRKGNEKIFSPLVDTDVTLMDFDDLGELIYKQTTGFNNQEIIINKIKEINTLEELGLLKRELLSNYTKYFKEAFQDKYFEKKWKQLCDIRNKVAHNNLFVIEDLLVAEELSEELSGIINSAEEKIEEFKFSLEEQEAIRQATIEAVKVAEAQSEPENVFTDISSSNLELGNAIGRENDVLTFKTTFRIITEDVFLRELAFAERTAPLRNYEYVGLKSFVTKVLGQKGFAYGPTYSLANILRDRGLIEIYDVEDGTAKAIRLVTYNKTLRESIVANPNDHGKILEYLEYLVEHRSSINFENEIEGLEVIVREALNINGEYLNSQFLNNFTYCISNLKDKGATIKGLENTLIKMSEIFPNQDLLYKTIGLIFLKKAQFEDTHENKFSYLNSSINWFLKGNKASNELKVVYTKYAAVANREICSVIFQKEGATSSYSEKVTFTKRLFEEAIEKSPKYPEIFKEYAIFLYLIGDEKAKEMDKKALALFNTKALNANEFSKREIEVELQELKLSREKSN